MPLTAWTATRRHRQLGNNVVAIANHADWTTHEVTVPIPDDTNTIAFGVFLAGPGRIELRDPELTQTGLA